MCRDARIHSGQLCPEGPGPLLVFEIRRFSLLECSFQIDHLSKIEILLLSEQNDIALLLKFVQFGLQGAELLFIVLGLPVKNFVGSSRTVHAEVLVEISLRKSLEHLDDFLGVRGSIRSLDHICLENRRYFELLLQFFQSLFDGHAATILSEFAFDHNIPQNLAAGQELDFGCDDRFVDVVAGYRANVRFGGDNGVRADVVDQKLDLGLVRLGSQQQIAENHDVQQGK